MKHIGKILKAHIEKRGLKKGEIAKNVGITYNYLSTIFTKESIDAKLLEKLFVAVGLHPAVVFDTPAPMIKEFCDIYATTLVGSPQISIGQDTALRDALADKERLLQEKERTIQILMAAQGIAIPEQQRNTTI